MPAVEREHGSRHPRALDPQADVARPTATTTRLVREPNENIVAHHALEHLHRVGVRDVHHVEVQARGRRSAGRSRAPGWEEYVRDRLDKDRAQSLANERWVLGETEVVSLERILTDAAGPARPLLRRLPQRVGDFLKDLDVRAAGEQREALDELQALSETPWPYSKLLTTLADNTRLELAPQSLANQSGQALLDKATQKAKQNQTVQTILGRRRRAAPNKRWISPVEDAFAPMVTFGVPPEAKEGDKPAPTAPLALRQRHGRRRSSDSWRT